MARTGNHYEKWLKGDNSINIQGRIMVLVHCPSPYCHLSINHVSFKSQHQLFARQDTEPTDRRTDGQSGDYMLPPLWNIIMNVSVAILSPLYQFTTVTQYSKQETIKYSMAGLHVLSDGRIVRQTDIIFS